MAYARPSIASDAYDLAPRLRPEDVAEIRAHSGGNPLDSLLEGLNGVECNTIVGNDAEIIGMFGLYHQPIFGQDQATVWLLASPSLRSIRQEFVAQTGRYLDGFHERFPVLWNLVDQRNEVHVRWLRRVGFTPIKLHPQFGVERRPFIEFVKIKEAALCASP